MMQERTSTAARSSDVRWPRDLLDQVAEAVQEVAANAIEPRFERLTRGDVHDKGVGELVTVADQEAEDLLAARLEGLLPGVPVVGEEGCSADPTRLDALRADRSWLVDPLDGTANFVAGSPDWGVMVALLDGGTTVASWMWRPVDRQMYVAERGAGATCNGQPMRVGPRPADPSQLRGAVLRGFLDSATVATVDANVGAFAAVTDGRRCAAVDYPAVVDGSQDFVLFWRTLPWDHAPGVLLLQEAGGEARRPDGTLYEPGSDGVGLLAAADSVTWTTARRLLG